MSDFDLLTIGDASYDVFLTPRESESFCRLDDHECLISFKYGDKIPVQEMTFTLGGNAANNAVGVKRLGVNVSLILTLGSDDIAAQIMSFLQKEGVNTEFVTSQPSTSSNYSVIISYMGERTIFTYKPPLSYLFPVKIPVPSWIYLTSMGDSFLPFYNHLIDFLKIHPQINLAYNPGSRQLRAGLSQIQAILARTRVLFVNRQEAEGLTGMKQSEGKEKELLSGLYKLGIKNPVVTDGNNGSFVFDGVKYLHCGVLPVDAFERTGAGDAFGSGTLAALITGKPFEEALIWGTVNSASVIGYTGAQKGLLYKENLDSWLQRAVSSGLRVSPF